MTNPCDLSAIEARKLIGNKLLSPVELTKSCLEQIEKYNSSINAVVAINHDEVLKDAQQAEDDVMSGNELGILHGLPVGIKDLNLVKNLRSTSGSKLYENRIPKEDDSVVKSIRPLNCAIEVCSYKSVLPAALPPWNTNDLPSEFFWCTTTEAISEVTAVAIAFGIT